MTLIMNLITITSTLFHLVLMTVASQLPDMDMSFLLVVGLAIAGIHWLVLVYVNT